MSGESMRTVDPSRCSETGMTWHGTPAMEANLDASLSGARTTGDLVVGRSTPVRVSTEEILNALTRIEGLKVAGRTSSFRFKGRNEDLKAIGAALGVAHVLEGSVRRQGDVVRITAQLVKVEDGFHVWSQNYERTLVDIFAVQDEISAAIAGTLADLFARALNLLD